MSRANSLGIFASVIASPIDHSVKRLRSIVRDDAHAESIAHVAAVTVSLKTGEDVESVAAGIRERVGMMQLRVSGALLLTMAALGEVECAYDVRTTVQGADDFCVITDSRPARAMAELVLLAA